MQLEFYQIHYFEIKYHEHNTPDIFIMPQNFTADTKKYLHYYDLNNTMTSKVEFQLLNG